MHRLRPVRGLSERCRAVLEAFVAHRNYERAFADLVDVATSPPSASPLPVPSPPSSPGAGSGTAANGESRAQSSPSKRPSPTKLELTGDWLSPPRLVARPLLSFEKATSNKFKAHVCSCTNNIPYLQNICASASTIVRICRWCAIWRCWTRRAAWRWARATGTRERGTSAAAWCSRRPVCAACASAASSGASRSSRAARTAPSVCSRPVLTTSPSCTRYTSTVHYTVLNCSVAKLTLHSGSLFRTRVHCFFVWNTCTVQGVPKVTRGLCNFIF